MIKILANTDQKITLRKYPTKYWFVCLCAIITLILVNYWILFNIPIYSSLTCDRGWLNTIDCQLIESAWFKPNLRHKAIKHIRKPEDLLGSGKTLLNVDIDTFHKRIKNNYYPNYGFVGLQFRDRHAYRFKKQAMIEVNRNKIENFIRDRNKKNKLTIEYRVFFLFSIPLLLLPVNILLPIFGILIEPITTYIFNFKQNKLKVVKKSLLTSNSEKHLINKLKIASINKRQDSILIDADTEISYLLDDFQNQQEASTIINQLQQYISSKST